MWSRELMRTKRTPQVSSAFTSHFTETMAHFYLLLSFLLLMTSEARGEQAAAAFHHVLIKLKDGTNVHSELPNLLMCHLL